MGNIKFLKVKKNGIYTICLVLAISLVLQTSGCKNNKSSLPGPVFNNSFLDRVLNDPSDYYYVDFKDVPDISSNLPIGMFDSGTGGLTVLNALVDFDGHSNSDHKPVHGGDGVPDFKTEEFIYFGDQANMPYGYYNEANRSDFLKELILRDALFLLGNKYYLTPDDRKFRSDKEPVKLVVIACNTATANGKTEIEKMLSDAESKIKVIGVIDAGVKGALEQFRQDEDGAIAVMATAGTVSSNGYLNTFNALKNSSGYTGNIEFFQHAGAGIAEVIDEEPGFFDVNASQLRKEYRGPSLTNEDLKIRNELIHVYNFDTTGNKLLYKKQGSKYTEIQLNCPENYIKYHLVSMCEKLKADPLARPLKVLILGCTHYPYFSEFFQTSLKELYEMKDAGNYLYRDVLQDSIIIIDPATHTAREVYEYLVSKDLFNMGGNINNSQFYISVPDKIEADIKTDSLGRFTFDYKYKRDTGHFYDTKQVPVSRLNTSNETLLRFHAKIPAVFDLIKQFNAENDKTKFLKPEERF
jgi:glutamate racemase